MAATAAITNQGQTYFMRLGLSLFMAFLSSIEADLGRFGPRIKSSRRTPSRRLPEGPSAHPGSVPALSNGTMKRFPG